MKNLHILYIIVCICSLTTNAQTSVHTTGGTATGSGGSATYSVGQIAYTNVNGSNGSVNHGVQQPTEFFVLDVDDYLDTNFGIRTYPNPTSDNLQLTIENLTANDVSYYLYDVHGRTLMHQKINELETTIAMQSLPSALYFLKITENNRTIKTLKIIKK